MQDTLLVCHLPDHSRLEIPLKVRLDTPAEVDYSLAGGILPYESLKLEYKKLGLMPLTTFSGEMQITMEVEAALTANDGTVLWRTHEGSYPHNDQLPAHHGRVPRPARALR